MNIQLYQIGVLTLSAVMLFFSIRGFIIREPGQTLFKFLVRLAVWGGLGVIAIYPNLTRVIAHFMGIEDNINAVILIGFIFTLLVVFKLLSAIDKIEQNVSELTRKIALKDLDAQVAKNKKTDRS